MKEEKDGTIINNVSKVLCHKYKCFVRNQLISLIYRGINPDNKLIMCACLYYVLTRFKY